MEYNLFDPREFTGITSPPADKFAHALLWHTVMSRFGEKVLFKLSDYGKDFKAKLAQILQRPVDKVRSHFGFLNGNTVLIEIYDDDETELYWLNWDFENTHSQCECHFVDMLPGGGRVCASLRGAPTRSEPISMKTVLTGKRMDV